MNYFIRVVDLAQSTIWILAVKPGASRIMRNVYSKR